MNKLLRALIQDVIDSTCSNGVVETAYVDKLADYLAANPPGPKDPIIVILAEGEVQDVQIPYEGYTVEVHAYVPEEWLDDEDPYDLEECTDVDENGDRYQTLVWSV